MSWQIQLLEERALAARSAAWWWKMHGCNQLADGGDFVALTKHINGGTNGLADRQARWERAKKAIAGAAWLQSYDNESQAGWAC